MGGRSDGQKCPGTACASVAAVCAVIVLPMTEISVYTAHIALLYLLKTLMSRSRMPVCVSVAGVVQFKSGSRKRQWEAAPAGWVTLTHSVCWVSGELSAQFQSGKL